jgi:hypothetical protein
MTTRRTGPSSRYFRLIVAFSLLAAVQGCFTLVRHEGISRLNYMRPPSDAPCTTCHSSAQKLAFVSSQRLDRARGPWGAFADPWWFSATDSVRSDGASSH